MNSPLYAVRQEVRSIESAILLLGDRTFHRIAMLAIFSELNAQEPPEILHMALVRARFCELAAGLRGLDANEQYLLGMFSLLPAMMRQPMEKLAAELPLRNEIRQALMGTKNSDSCLLSWIEAHERDDQATREAIGKTYCLNQQSLMEHYLGALLLGRVCPALRGLKPRKSGIWHQNCFIQDHREGRVMSAFFKLTRYRSSAAKSPSFVSGIMSRPQKVMKAAAQR